MKETCLYQSQLWRDIQTKVYGKKSMEIEIFGKKYFCLIKEKKVWPFFLQWYQIMGVILPDDPGYVKSEIQRVKKQLQNKRWLISLQFWFVNSFAKFKNKSWISQEFIDSVKAQRLAINDNLTQQYGLKLAFRENMPVSTILYDVHKTDEELLDEMHESCRTKVKRSMKKDMMVKILSTKEEEEKFYEDWRKISGLKGFWIIPREQYFKLLAYLKETHQGNILVTELDGDIVWGSILLKREKSFVYLYGFWNRKYQNIWGHHFLKFKIFGLAREQGMDYVDAMGGAPTWFPKHHLKGVSDFKESLWWEKIEFYGNFDLVLRPFWYGVFKGYKKIQELWKHFRGK